MPRMRRWLAIFLLVFLPLQASWAAVTGYCQHESGAAAQHFGHHEHKHHSDDGGSTDAKVLSGGIDSDCAACHAGCVCALTGIAQFPVVLPAFEGNLWRPSIPSSPPTAVPERPNWAVSA